MPRPSSFPYLAIAKKYEVDYGQVLLIAHHLSHVYDTPNDNDEKSIAHTDRLLRIMQTMDEVTFEEFTDEIERADAIFYEFSTGRRNYETGELEPKSHAV